MPTFRYKKTNINYHSSGKGSVVVLLHGFLENIKIWKEIIPVLAKNNRVISIDLFGHGKSENLGYIHTMEAQAIMAKELLNSLRLRKFTLIGHSMGGYIALAFADLFPNSVKKICLMNSTAFADSDEKKINRDRAIVAVKKNHKTFIRISIPQLFSKENRVKLKLEIEEVTQDCLSTSKQGIIASLEGMKIRKDHTEILKNPSFKKLMIMGKKDTVLDYQTHLKQTINTNIEVCKLSDGHMSYIENKSELIKILKKFVK